MDPSPPPATACREPSHRLTRARLGVRSHRARRRAHRARRRSCRRMYRCRLAPRINDVVRSYGRCDAGCAAAQVIPPVLDLRARPLCIPAVQSLQASRHAAFIMPGCILPARGTRAYKLVLQIVNQDETQDLHLFAVHRHINPLEQTRSPRTAAGRPSCFCGVTMPPPQLVFVVLRCRRPSLFLCLIAGGIVTAHCLL